MNRVVVYLVSVLLMFVFSACRQHGVEANFEATLPVLNEEENDGAKTYFVGERYVYWESSDSTDIYTVSGNTYANEQQCSLGGGAGTRDGSFRLFIGDEDDPATFGTTLAVYPARSEKSSTDRILDNSISYNNSTSEFTVECHLADKQYYRPKYNFGGTTADLTFSKKSLPMVAYCSSGAPRLRFYTPCGIMRLQLFSSDGLDSKGFVHLSSITITCTGTNNGSPSNISGDFVIEDYDTMEPTLVPTSEDAEDKTIIYDCVNDTNVLLNNEIKSFYVVVPYIETGSSNNRTLYNFTVTFTNDRGQSQTGELVARIARNTITKIPAIDVKTKNIGIVGNGTALRPFQIYDVEDLVKVRDAFNSGLANPTLNGVSLKPSDGDSVYFVLSRGDITLTTSNWNRGIRFNEGCVFYGSENTITNNSANPIFASSEGTIRHLYVDGTCSASSPLCNDNSGLITHCHSNVVDNSSVDFAGLCFLNSGTIKHCDYGIIMGTSTVLTINSFAAICDQNVAGGRIEECFCDCNINHVGGIATTICRSNAGTIDKCYMTKNIESDKAFGICYTNSGTISRCRTQSGCILNGDKQAAGICYSNSGTIDMTYNLSEITTQSQDAAGLVITNSGTIRNFYNEGNVTSESGKVSGAVVENKTSSILYNGFNNGELTAYNINGGALVTGLACTSLGSIQNCYTTGTITLEGGTGTEDAICTSSGSFTTCYYLHGLPSTTDANDMTDANMKAASFVTTLNSWVTTNGTNYKQWVTSSSYPRLNM